MSPHVQIHAPGDGREFPFTQTDFRTIAALVHEHSGIVLGTHKRDMVYSRLARRLRALRLKSFREYCALLDSGTGADEIGSLINAITTNLTKFFREPHHFEHFQNRVLADIWKSSRGEKPRVRVWSAACSTGEEPYSIAMTAMASQQAARPRLGFPRPCHRSRHSGAEQGRDRPISARGPRRSARPDARALFRKARRCP